LLRTSPPCAVCLRIIKSRTSRYHNRPKDSSSWCFFNRRWRTAIRFQLCITKHFLHRCPWSRVIDSASATLTLGCPYLRGSVAHPRPLAATIQTFSWNRMINLRPLPACNSEQYFKFPASDVWSETIHILVRKTPLTRALRKIRLPQRLASYLWARFKHLLEVVWKIWDHFWHAIRSNTFHFKPQIGDSKHSNF
jgi:hypothetical protein